MVSFFSLRISFLCLLKPSIAFYFIKEITGMIWWWDGFTGERGRRSEVWVVRIGPIFTQDFWLSPPSLFQHCLNHNKTPTISFLSLFHLILYKYLHIHVYSIHPNNNHVMSYKFMYKYTGTQVSIIIKKHFNPMHASLSLM